MFTKQEETRFLEIKDRISNATYGPWKVYESDEGILIGTVDNHPQLKAPAPVITMGTFVQEPHKRVYMDSEDADFIAHSRQDIEWLVQKLEKLKGTK